MFERYVGAKAEKPTKARSVTTTVSVGFHVLAGIGLVIYSFWRIEKLPVRDSSVLYMAANMATPPPPPPPPPPPKKSSVKKTQTTPKPDVLIQPPKDPPKERPPEEESSEEDDGEEGGQEGGVKGGVKGGVLGGELGGVEGGMLGGDLGGPPPPPPPEEPKVVAQAMIEGQRIAGSKDILLPDGLLASLKVQGVTKLQTKVELCLDAGGSPSKISFKKPSGYAEVDSIIKAKMQEWRYKPYVVQGKAVPICVIVLVNHTVQ